MAAIARDSFIHVSRQYTRPRAPNIEHHDQVVSSRWHDAHWPSAAVGRAAGDGFGLALSVTARLFEAAVAPVLVDLTLVEVLLAGCFLSAAAFCCAAPFSPVPFDPAPFSFVAFDFAFAELLAAAFQPGLALIFFGPGVALATGFAVPPSGGFASS